MNIKIRNPEPPHGLITALSRQTLYYSVPRDLIHLIQLGDAIFIGVFGDCQNAAYEWFEWRSGALKTSNAGWGSPEAALCDCINQIVL